MEIEIRQEFLADGLSCVAFKKYIVWQDYCCTSASFEHQHHMLKEVELVVLGAHVFLAQVFAGDHAAVLSLG